MPLYDEADAHRALGHFHPVGFHRQIEVAEGVTVEFRGSGHLLGSAYVVTRLSGGRTILFGGDLGRYARPVLTDPEDAVQADTVLVESTYGDRDHPTDDQGSELAVVIRETAARGGKVVIPAFAIGRVEELLYWIRRLERERRIPVLPVYVDSPMASEALRFYIQRAHELDPEMQPAAGKPGARDVSAFATARFQVIASPQQSKELTASRKTGIVISSSGMATGGRVLHHLAAALPDPKNTVLLVGFQAEGTRGRQLLEGAGSADSRPASAGARPCREGELDVRPRRSQRDRALAQDAAGAAEPSVPRAWRAQADGRAEGDDQARAGMGCGHAAAPRKGEPVTRTSLRKER
jgi:metallo-beta-lactamase family protein